MDLVPTQNHIESANSEAVTDSFAQIQESTVRASSWITRAVHLRRYSETPEPTRPRPQVPDWIANPIPAHRPSQTKRTNLSQLVSRCWHERWRNRDWDTANEFFRAVDQDECPVHDIIPIGDPHL